MRRSLIPALAVSALALMGSLPARAADTVANIGTTEVTAAELQGFVDTLNPQQREQAAKDPKISSQLVRTAIGRKLLLDEAEKAGWDKKSEVEAQIERAREEVVLGTYLRSVSLPASDYPSLDDLKAAYEQNKDHLFQYHLAQIFIAEPPGSNKDQLDAIAKKAAELAKKAKAKGADFAALAKANSDDKTSAAKGGDLGWLAQNQLLPEMLGAVMALGDKGVSEPVHAAGGWHILSLSGVKQAEFDQVKDQIANVLREAKLQQNQQAYVEKLLDTDHVTVNETAAAALFAAKK